MELRKLTRTDLEVCWQCRLRALEFAPTAFGSTLASGKATGPERLKRIFADDKVDEIVFGAVLKDIVVGMIILSRENGEKSQHKASITSMYVDLDHRGNGIGGKLLDLAIEHARIRLNSKAVYLTVESGNSAALRLYESRGFQSWGRHVNWSPKTHFFMIEIKIK